MVPAVRAFLAQRHIALLLCLATLLLKVFVPAGYMVDNVHGQIAVTLCSGTAPAPMMIGMAGHGKALEHGQALEHRQALEHGQAQGHGPAKEHSKAEMPCAFTGLSAAALGAIDPIQLAALIAFIVAIGIRGLPLPPPASRAYLRPPLRGPPAYL
jgi:hypothetical protein